MVFALRKAARGGRPFRKEFLCGESQSLGKQSALDLHKLLPSKAKEYKSGWFEAVIKSVKFALK